MTAHPTSLRLDQSLLDRAEALVSHLAGDPAMAWTTTPNRSAVLRLAVARGLDVLEREYEKKRRHEKGVTP